MMPTPSPQADVHAFLSPSFNPRKKGSLMNDKGHRAPAVVTPRKVVNDVGGPRSKHHNHNNNNNNFGGCHYHGATEASGDEGANEVFQLVLKTPSRVHRIEDHLSSGPQTDPNNNRSKSGRLLLEEIVSPNCNDHGIGNSRGGISQRRLERSSTGVRRHSDNRGRRKRCYNAGQQHPVVSSSSSTNPFALARAESRSARKSTSENKIEKSLPTAGGRSSAGRTRVSFIGMQRQQLVILLCHLSWLNFTVDVSMCWPSLCRFLTLLSHSILLLSAERVIVKTQ